MGNVWADALEREVRRVAAGCKGCPRRGSACSMCDREGCAALVRRIDEDRKPVWRREEEREAASGRRRPRQLGRPSGLPDVSNWGEVRKYGRSAYPDGCPCKTCRSCSDTGRCEAFRYKIKMCADYWAWRAEALERARRAEE